MVDLEPIELWIYHMVKLFSINFRPKIYETLLVPYRQKLLVSFVTMVSKDNFIINVSIYMC